MSVYPLGPPVAEPITVDELIAIARVVAGDEEMSLMPNYISAAREFIEKTTGRSLVERSYALVVPLPVLPTVVPLPYPPLQSVDGVWWIDDQGFEWLVDSSCYRVQIYTTPGALIWITPPVTATTPAAWRINYSAGAPVVDLEASLKRLVGVLAAHYLIAGRDAVVSGTIVSTVPLAFDESLDPWRLLVLP